MKTREEKIEYIMKHFNRKDRAEYDETPDWLIDQLFDIARYGD